MYCKHPFTFMLKTFYRILFIGKVLTICDPIGLFAYVSPCIQYIRCQFDSIARIHYKAQVDAKIESR